MSPAGEPGWHIDTVSRPQGFYLGTTVDQQIELNHMQHRSEADFTGYVWEAFQNRRGAQRRAVGGGSGI